MTLFTHAVVGYCIAGWPGVLMACAADVPVLLCDGVQLAQGVDVEAAKAAHSPPTGGRALWLWRAHLVAHSGVGLVPAIAGPLGMAYSSHVALDMVTHDRTWLGPGAFLNINLGRAFEGLTLAFAIVWIMAGGGR